MGHFFVAIYNILEWKKVAFTVWSIWREMPHIYFTYIGEESYTTEKQAGLWPMSWAYIQERIFPLVPPTGVEPMMSLYSSSRQWPLVTSPWVARRRLTNVGKHHRDETNSSSISDLRKKTVCGCYILRYVLTRIYERTKQKKNNHRLYPTSRLFCVIILLLTNRIWIGCRMKRS